MNPIGVGFIIGGVLLMIYSIISKDKVNIYNNRKVKNVIDEKGFLKLQFCGTFLNGILVIVLGCIIVYYDITSFYIVLIPLTTSVISYFTRLTGKNKNYIQ